MRVLPLWSLALTLVLFALVLFILTRVQDPDAPLNVGTEPLACAEGYHTGPWQEPVLRSTSGTSTIAAVLSTAPPPRVIFVGERHAQPHHVAAQLEIICRLMESGRNVAIAVEFLQQPFQFYVDEYLAGRLDDAALRRLTDYDRRWGYPFYLYGSILRFARDRDVPLIAMNVPSELVRKVALQGFDGLDEAELLYLPDGIERAPRDYGPWLQTSFRQASAHHGLDFERFEMAQLVWDEGMSERIASFLSTEEDSTVVVLAGNGHIAWRGGIPDRLRRRADVTTLVLSNVDGPVDPAPDSVDHFIHWVDE